MPAWAKHAASFCWKWLGEMSGAISIPIGGLAVFWGGTPRFWLSVLAYAGMTTCAIKMALKAHGHEKKAESRIGALEAQLDDKTRKREIYDFLGKALSLLESRINAISGMSSKIYIDSIMGENDKLDEESLGKIRDVYSMLIVEGTAHYIGIHLGDGKRALFISTTELKFTKRFHATEILKPYDDKRQDMIDNLQHWAKNLIQILKTLE